MRNAQNVTASCRGNFGEISMRRFFFAVSALALTACHTTQPSPLEGGQPQLVVEAAPLPIPPPPVVSVVKPNTEGEKVREFSSQEAFEKFASNPYKRVTDNPVSTFSSDVDTASYSVARRQLRAGRLPKKDSIRVEEILNYFDYDYPKPKSKREPFRPNINIVDSPWNSQTQLIHIGVQGYEPPKSKRPPMNLVFLIDTSGSMEDPDKLPLLKQ